MKYVVHPFHLGRPENALAAEAAWCAADQDGFFEYQHALYENFGASFNPASLTNMAAEVGLDQAEFSECLTSRSHRADIESARQAAASQGINSTPTFLVNNRRVEGNQPYPVFQDVINQELSRSQ